MTHDFKAALYSMSDRSDWVEENWNTIIAALRIADKLMDEPSSKAIREMINHEFKYDQEHVPVYDIIREEWTVLRDHMLSELQLTKTD